MKYQRCLKRAACLNCVFISETFCEPYTKGYPHPRKEVFLLASVDIKDL